MIEEIDFDDKNLNCEIDFPSICPHCLQGGHPTYLSANSRLSTIPEEKGKRIIAIIFLCATCECTYLGEYKEVSKKVYQCVNIYPHPKPKLDIPFEIKEHFPDFYEIYRQSAIAESSNLDKIAGMGYRKAVEFLVKSYLIDLYPDERENILKEALGASIKRIEYKNIQMIAKAATWLGNDQTHIIQKHPDYDVEDIKIFTLALSHLILAEKVVEKAAFLVRD
ncbi:Hypothetical protein LUCI_0816 [Lucifera butyrica]|uniref:DUF4145 domain-containing protein n=1 Tax=Lucifera butyrica TaxID=1351585 RepID=A0A498QZI2_9FIRM|nr:DUF4145 domain-containing protein [Lucifera butyrica]VBB05606.1 Hypothetical protein LUCI_0816 [Lucifera butyrica]